MNQHIYNLRMIQRILRVADGCNSGKEKYTKVKKSGEASFSRLKEIVEEKFSGRFTDEMIREVKTAIFDFNGTKEKSDADFIGIPEWNILCSEAIRNGILLEQTNMAVHAAWILFQNDLRDRQLNSSKSFENIWFTFMNRLIVNGYQKNVQLIHNYLFLMHRFSTLDHVESGEKEYYVTIVTLALLDGLEINGLIEPELLKEIVDHIWDNPIFNELFKGYPALAKEDTEFKAAYETSTKTLVDAFWLKKEVVDHLILQLKKESNISMAPQEPQASELSNPGLKGISREALATLIEEAESAIAPSIAVKSNEVDDLVSKLSALNIDNAWLQEESDPESDTFSVIDNIALARRAKSFEKSTSSGDSESDPLTKSLLEKSTSFSGDNSSEPLSQSLTGKSESSADKSYNPLYDSLVIKSAQQPTNTQEPVEPARKLANSQ